MAYGKRKKGGQRLMEISRAARKAAKKKSTAAKAKTKFESIRKQLGIKAKPKATPKSTAGGRNRTALRTPKRASSSVAKKKKVATPKSDAGKYMGPYSKRTTSAKNKTTAKRKSSGPAPLPKNIQGMARPPLSALPGNILKGSAIAFPGSIAVRGIGKKAIESGLKTKAGKNLMKSLTNLFKRKSSTPGRRKATPTEKAKTKRTEEGYKKFEEDRKERSRKMARGRR